MLARASIVFFAFIGFDIVATMVEGPSVSTGRPSRDSRVAGVALLYVAVSVVLSGMVPYT